MRRVGGADLPGGSAISAARPSSTRGAVHSGHECVIAVRETIKVTLRRLSSLAIIETSSYLVELNFRVSGNVDMGIDFSFPIEKDNVCG